MTYPSKIVDRAEVRRWIKEGKTYPEMSRIYQERHEAGVPGYDIVTDQDTKEYISPTTFSNFRAAEGLPYRYSVDMKARLKPWKVRKEHQGKGPDVHLNYLARMMSGKPVPPARRKSTENFWADLQEQGLVVTYSPELGYILVPRREGVDGPYIREPEERREKALARG